MKQVRIKNWFLAKNAVNHYGTQQRFSNHWWNVTHETDKAYHISGLEMYCWQGGWVPKSAVLEVREDECENCEHYQEYRDTMRAMLYEVE